MIEVELRINQYNNKFYYIKGTSIFHRENGPAIEYYNGNKCWYQNDKLHRLDGPAIECVDGDKYWYFNGKSIACQTQEHFEKSKEYRKFKLKAFL